MKKKLALLGVCAGVSLVHLVHAEESPADLQKETAVSEARQLREYRVHWSRGHQDGSGRRNVVNRVTAPVSRGSQPDKASPVPGSVPAHKGMTNIRAVIYGNQFSLLRWQYKGKEYEALSNVNFHHLTGFSTFEADGALYGINMFVSDAPEVSDYPGEKAVADLPGLATGGAQCVLVKGDGRNDEAMKIVDLLHRLYDAEKDDLVASYRTRQAKQTAETTRKQSNEEGASKKPNVIINYWKRGNK